jgi:RHS repeat-associated protein
LRKIQDVIDVPAGVRQSYVLNTLPDGFYVHYFRWDLPWPLYMAFHSDNIDPWGHSTWGKGRLFLEPGIPSAEAAIIEVGSRYGFDASALLNHYDFNAVIISPVHASTVGQDKVFGGGEWVVPAGATELFCLQARGDGSFAKYYRWDNVFRWGQPVPHAWRIDHDGSQANPYNVVIHPVYKVYGGFTAGWWMEYYPFIADLVMRPRYFDPTPLAASATGLTPPSPPARDCGPNGCPPAGESAGAVPPAEGAAVSPSTTGDGVVDPATGAVDVLGDALIGGGLHGWGHRPVWSAAAYGAAGSRGPGWTIEQLPAIHLQASGKVLLQGGGSRAFAFKPNGSGYMAIRHNSENLAPGGVDELRFTDTRGNVSTFHAFTPAVPVELRGKMKALTQSGGHATSFTYVGGSLTHADRSDGIVTQTTQYDAIAGGPNSGRTGTVTLLLTVNGQRNVVRRIEYEYYNGEPGEFGDLGQLARSTVKDAAGATVDQTLYRYYRAGDVLGQPGLMKSVVRGRQYARLANAVSNPLIAPDSTIATFADLYFEYDAAGRVALKRQLGASCTCVGSTGQGAFKYTYTTNANPDGYNAWRTKCVELLPDGTDTDDTDNDRVTTYSNFAGQPMLVVRRTGSAGPEWRTGYRYDASGRLIEQFNPSALTGHDEAAMDLFNVVSGNGQHIADAVGLTELTEYGMATTATTTVPGDVLGYVKYRRQRVGETTAPVTVELVQYVAHTDAGGVTIYKVANVTRYRNANGTGAQVTSYAYTWHGTTNAVASRTTTNPVVTTAQNGSNVATRSVEVYDVFGRTTWSKDAEGFLHYTQYDPGTGAAVKTITDVQSTRTADFAGLPAGWVTPAGGGAHLVSQSRVDLLGRTTKATDAVGNVTFTIYKDPQFEIRTYPGWNATTSKPTAPTQIVREDRVRNYRERLSMAAIPTLTGTEPNGLEGVSSLATLSRELLDNGGRVVSRDVYHTLPAYSQNSPLGTLNAHYYRSEFFYDKRGRQARIKDAAGTITRLEYDTQDRLISRWSGTNDSVASGFWSPSNNGAPSNIVQLEALVYDGGLAGDGNLTSRQAFASATVSYTTRHRYDGRNRHLVTRNPDGVATLRTLDNLGQCTQEDTFADANNDLQVAASELRGRTIRLFDERGQIYRSTAVAVNPASGAAGNGLTTNSWYTARGLVAKTRTANGLQRKQRYDGAGRAVRSSLSADASESTYADALTTSGDTVIEQTATILNANGDPVTTTTAKRLDNDTTSTGDLSLANAWLGVVVRWYDAARRPTSVCDYGRDNGTTRYVWSTTGTLIDSDADGLPNEAEAGPRTVNSSDNYRVSRTEYQASGWPYRTFDNLGRLTETTFDAAGKPRKVIEARSNGVAEEAETGADRITEIIYLPGWRTSVLRAHNPKGLGLGVELQNTTHLYTSTVNASWVTDTIYPDSADTTAAGSDQVSCTYDRLGRKTSCMDQRGTIHGYGYDSAGRLSADTVTAPGLAVDATVRRIAYAYDSLSRIQLVTSYDAVSAGNVINQVKTTYDSWGNVARSDQSHAGAVTTGTPAVQYAFADGAVSGAAKYVRPTQLIYPSGTILHTIYPGAGTIGDALNRPVALADDAAGTARNVAYPRWVGASMAVQVDHPKVAGGLALDYGTAPVYAGLDRFGRLLDQKWRNTAGIAIDRFQYTYDREDRKKTRDQTWSGAPATRDEQYAYDNLDRLVRFNRGTLASGAIADAASSFNQDWTPDELGNWRAFRIDADGGANSWVDQARAHNKANEIDTTNAHNDTVGNSISGTANWLDPVYDAAGNLTTGPRPGAETTAQSYVYDAWNRLTVVKNTANAVVATYRYDGLGRRIQKIVGATTTDVYLTPSWQEIETRINAVVAERAIYDLRYIDAIAVRSRDANLDGTFEEVASFTHDREFNVTAMIPMTGVVGERYGYEPYGKRTVFAANGTTVRAMSSYGVNYGFTGRSHDAESVLVYFRNRMWDTGLGRFVNRDPIRYAGGGMSLYAGYFVLNGADPAGLYEIDVHQFLTQFLAENAGLSAADAAMIGEQAQALDGDNDPRNAMYNGVNQQGMHDYHFVDPVQLAHLADSVHDMRSLGEYLHALEDTYSHSKGMEDRNWEYYDDLGFLGHGLHCHEPDQTWRNPGKGMKMAKETYEQLQRMIDRLASEGKLIRIGQAKDWGDIEDSIYKFMAYKPQTYVQFMYGIPMLNASAAGYDAKIKILNPSYALPADERRSRTPPHLSNPLPWQSRGR